jgi:proline iminopeptidase
MALDLPPSNFFGYPELDMHPSEPSLDDTLVRRVGSGPELLVFHGGPGFDHRYLTPHLEFLAERFTLVFFDQPGSGETRRPAGDLTFDHLARHAAQVIRASTKGSRVHVFAHSFGALVLLGALSHLSGITADGFLINPVPVTASQFDAMRSALFSRMPEDLLTGIANLPQGPLPRQQLSTLLQFYVAPTTNPELDELSFDFGIYSQVYASLGNFDYSLQTPLIQNCSLIIGDADFINLDMLSPLAGLCRSVSSLPGAGHFCFAEKPALFRELILDQLATNPLLSDET